MKIATSFRLSQPVVLLLQLLAKERRVSQARTVELLLKDSYNGTKRRWFIYGLSFSGRIAYVGLTRNPLRRWEYHVAGNDKGTMAWIYSIRPSIPELNILETIRNNKKTASMFESLWIRKLRHKKQAWLNLLPSR
jgi:predicted GIY-YIG superfamily endonuclease